MTTQKIKVDLVETHSAIRQHCHACGGRTERVHVVARVTEGPHKGLTICENCLKSGDIQQKMIDQAEIHAYRAEMFRAVAPDLEWPTYGEWKSMNDRIEQEVVAFYENEVPR